MAANLSREAYRELVEEVRASIRTHIPSGSVVLVASKGDEELVRLEGYRAWHFPRDEWGAYAGHHPASSVEAVTHLHHLYSQGARYLVFPSTATWWLEHYRELAGVLDAEHRLVVSIDGVCVIYELQQSATVDAYLSEGEQDDEWLSDQHASGEAAKLLSLVRPVRRQPLRVLTVLARCGMERYATAEDELVDLFNRRMQGIERRTIIVDNALPRGYAEKRDNTSVIGGDNSSREFSAFDRAVDAVGADIWSYDFVHFATGSFRTLYVAYLERFETALLQAMAGRPACIGHVDCYNEPIAIRTYHSQHWIRSCFFFLPPAEAMALGGFVSVDEATAIVTDDPANPFRADAPISARYRDYIAQWLTGNGTGQGVEWHSTFALTQETMTDFAQKTRAILNEHLLSIRLQALGCHLVDVTWLATMLKHTDASAIPLSTSWREQLANRDRDRVVLSESQTERAPAAV